MEAGFRAALLAMAENYGESKRDTSLKTAIDKWFVSGVAVSRVEILTVVSFRVEREYVTRQIPCRPQLSPDENLRDA
jgi:hypothetical protein